MLLILCEVLIQNSVNFQIIPDAFGPLMTDCSNISAGCDMWKPVQYLKTFQVYLKFIRICLMYLFMLSCRHFV